jgi:predicted lactoylglutathione lyase
MNRMIFVNLPVVDLPRAMAFYAALGFRNEPRFTDETAACMVVSDTIHVMLLTHPKWQSFTDRPLPPPGASEVSLCISCDDRAAVDAMVDAAAGHGGQADVNPVMDMGFMYGRSFTDPDDHVWEPMYMDMAAAEAAMQPAAA